MCHRGKSQVILSCEKCRNPHYGDQLPPDKKATCPHCQEVTPHVKGRIKKIRDKKVVPEKIPRVKEKKAFPKRAKAKRIEVR